MADVYLFDLDGTIADFSHRRRHLNKKPPDFEAFYTDCAGDIPIKHVIRTLQLLHFGGAIIIIVTGRRAETREVTEKWLKAHDVPYFALFMRPIGDRRPDYEVKPEMLMQILNRYKKEEIIGVFDDRQQVVDMWGIIGLKVFQVK